jgi:ATP-dependent DNA helicase RecG
MNSCLPIGVEELLGGGVETARLELKASWDPQSTGHQVLKTLCAFANDLQNLNGGYVVLGVAEDHGAAIRPAAGLDDAAIDAAQKWIRGNASRIEPVYMPVFDVVELDGKRVLVLWAPASEIRPHTAPDGPKGERRHWVRIGSETVQAKDSILTSLMQQTARVPFDDRRALHASNEDISLTLVREFLHDVRSDLVREPDGGRVYRAMQIVSPVNGHTVPRNIALLSFSPEPEQWFRGARIEVVEFPDEAGGDVLEERSFAGPLHHQVRQCLNYLESMTTRHLEKRGDHAEARGWLSFPVPALREAVVNAVYHRSYESSVEPTKVYLYPDRIEVISYPGPAPGIELAHLQGGAPAPPVPARNRRIGELLKELRLAEGRGTGLPKIRRTMSANGSPEPRFDFDVDRTYFRITLPAHPEYVALSLLRAYAYQKATGHHGEALAHLTGAWRAGQRSPSVAATLVRERAEVGDLAGAEAVIADLERGDLHLYARAMTTLAAAHAEVQQEDRARELLNNLPPLLAARDAFEAAIVERRLGRQEQAHAMFERAGDLVLQDARALHEFAQTKLHLAETLRRAHRPSDRETRRRLLQEAVSFLERVVHMEAPPIRHAWAWFNLGQARSDLRAPRQEVEAAYLRAQQLAPDEPRFRKALKDAAR